MVLQLGHSSKSVYDDFRKLIREELRPRLRSERDTAQGLLAEAAQGFGLCPVQRVDVQPHRLCRLEELRLLQLVKEACNASASMRRVEDQRCKAFGGGAALRPRADGRQTWTSSPKRRRWCATRWRRMRRTRRMPCGCGTSMPSALACEESGDLHARCLEV